MVRKLPDGMEECIIVHTGREGGHACCQGVDQVVPQSLTNATTYVVLHSRMSQRERLMSKERNETESGENATLTKVLSLTHFLR